MVKYHAQVHKPTCQPTGLRARRLFFPQLGSRTTIKQHGLVRNRNLLGHNDNILFFLLFKMKKLQTGKNFDHLCFYLSFQDCRL